MRVYWGFRGRETGYVGDFLCTMRVSLTFGSGFTASFRFFDNANEILSFDDMKKIQLTSSTIRQE